jgi:iron complex outermembrane receptor protein
MAMSLAFSGAVAAQDQFVTKEVGVVTIQSGRPSSLPSSIPTTLESIKGSEIQDKINATDSEDALKYFPSLLVRKRYEGDYNHAMLSSRASGTGNPARSAVYADGILLSNYLGNSVSGLSFPPRWGMVTPEEIERVDVMYGPFSAAYPGNSVGAVVDYVTRMPTSFEAHAKVAYASQGFQMYNTDTRFSAWQTSASMGNKNGDWSWFINLHHTDSAGQPLTFATRTLSTGSAPSNGIVVNGWMADKNTANADIYVIGTGTQYNTQQDHAKIKLAYDFSNTLRATYTLGTWQNSSEGRPVSYLTNASTGAPVTSGPVVINGKQFGALTGADFALTNESLTHYMHGVSLKSNAKSVFDWEIAGSLYDYSKDQKRQNAASATLPVALTSGAGTIADGAGTGWNNVAVRGTWRPIGFQGAHVLDFGYQADHYKLEYLTSNIAGNWTTNNAGSQSSFVGGQTQLQSFYAQDTWRMTSGWMSVLGLRSETWRANAGTTQIAANGYTQFWKNREESYLSPKAALAYQLSTESTIKASTGRAVRMPTVFELYGATSTTNSRYINDPNLKPERSLTTELSYEKEGFKSNWRLTYFHESTQDGLFSQSIFDPVANASISRVQNVDRIQTQGLESSLNAQDWLVLGLDLSGSLTYTDSIIKENAGFVAVAGDTLGKRQPNIPRWRATAVATYRISPAWTGTLAARYSGAQFRTLNNADINGLTYMGVSKFFTVDVRARYKVDAQTTLAIGVDNLNNDRYWNFHPYPQRTLHAEIKYDIK